MATQPAEPRNERVVVLMTASEKRDVADKASALGLSVGEYMRLAAEFGAMTVSERAELDSLIADLETMNQQLGESFAELEAAARQEIDEDALRARYRAELEAMDIDWAAFADRLGLTGMQSERPH